MSGKIKEKYQVSGIKYQERGEGKEKGQSEKVITGGKRYEEGGGLPEGKFKAQEDRLIKKGSINSRAFKSQIARR